MVLLNNVFGGSSDTILREVREVIKQAAQIGEKDFPANAINKRLESMGRLVTFNDNTIESFLSITYSERESFLALSLLYDEKNWGTMKFHKDHIFPKSKFTSTKMRQAGIPQDRYEDYLESRDLMANLQLLVGAENEEKSDTDFEEWLFTRDNGYRKRHFIPDDDSLFEFSRFPDFIAAREELIQQRLRQIL